MEFDIVFVTYNSEKWISNCLESVFRNQYNLNKISITVVDNKSTDKTCDELYKFKEKYKTNCKAFNVVKLDENVGFGRGNNIGFGYGKAPYVLFLNIDTELDNNLFNELSLDIEQSLEEVGLWELRQFPYEHPKIYDPVTSYTSWSSGAAFAIKREIFNKIDGFDKNIFMYAEDVDLSWRVRLIGYKLKYVPKAVIYHYSYKEANEIKPNQYYSSIINNILLRYKFGGIYNILKGYRQFLGIMMNKGPFKNSRKVLFTKFLKHFIQIAPFMQWNLKNRKLLKGFQSKFMGWDYEIIREGAFYINEIPISTPMVSIIVRTCGRPQVLKETLISLRNQTYRNIEIIVVEDGENKSEKFIKDEFSDLNIIYKHTGEKVGRCKAGNIGLKTACGKYLNFLDDDDVFFADHVEVLVNQIEKNSQYRAAYTLAFETPIKIKSKEPYLYEEVYHSIVYRQSFNRILLFHHNYIPIQSIMFSRDIFLEEGGFDENLDVLEDWDLWVRYSLKNNFLNISKVTSIYRVPFDKNVSSQRQKELDDALENLRNKHSEYFSKVNVLSTAIELQQMLDSYAIKITAEALEKMKLKRPFVIKMVMKLKYYLKKIFR